MGVTINNAIFSKKSKARDFCYSLLQQKAFGCAWICNRTERQISCIKWAACHIYTSLFTLLIICMAHIVTCRQVEGKEEVMLINNSHCNFINKMANSAWKQSTWENQCNSFTKDNTGQWVELNWGLKYTGEKLNKKQMHKAISNHDK